MHPNVKDLTWKRFWKLIVIKMLEERTINNKIIYKCKCDCWNEHIVTSECLWQWKTKSCWCLRSNAPNKQKDREYAIWKQLYNSNIVRQNKKWWIDNGITFDEFKILANWLCFYCWREWINKLTDRWHYKINWKLVSDTVVTYNWIDRIDSDLWYTKDNVVTCCRYCNRAKMDLKQDEFLNHIKRIYDFKIK